MAHLIVLNFLYRNPCRADPLSAKKVMSKVWCIPSGSVFALFTRGLLTIYRLKHFNIGIITRYGLPHHLRYHQLKF